MILIVGVLLAPFLLLERRKRLQSTSLSVSKRSHTLPAMTNFVYNYNIYHVTEVTYQPSLLDMPDLPSWLHYSYSPTVHTGFIYGTPPPGIGDFKVQYICSVML